MSHKILVVDDEPEIRDVLEKFLTKSGYEVTTAASGSEAIEKATRDTFSLMLCDVMMPASPAGGPQMDGLMTLTNIRRINKFLPVLMMSGAATHDMVIKALEKGAVDFIAKPISFVQAINIIRKTLNQDDRVPPEYSSPVARLLREGYLGTLKMINQLLEMKNPYLKGHSQRVAAYAVKISRGLKLPDNTVEVINYAAVLHDIGKIGVSDMILSKPAKLNDQEWGDIKAHPALSRTMVERLQLFRAEEPLILHHHEHYNGAGYPKGLKQEEIPLGARIIAVADAYDAMTSLRPYRKAMDTKTAKGIIKEFSGRQFDPEVTEVFLNIV